MEWQILYTLISLIWVYTVCLGLPIRLDIKKLLKLFWFCLSEYFGSLQNLFCLNSLTLWANREKYHCHPLWYILWKAGYTWAYVRPPCKIKRNRKKRNAHHEPVLAHPVTQIRTCTEYVVPGFKFFSLNSVRCCKGNKWNYHDDSMFLDRQVGVNSVELDQPAPEGAVQLGSTLFTQTFLPKTFGSLL